MSPTLEREFFKTVAHRGDRGMRALVSSLLCVVASVVSGCANSDVAVPAAAAVVVPSSCGSTARVHSFGAMQLASQPAAADFETAKAAGVRTVINLRHESEIKDFDERAVVTGLGMTYVNLPWHGAEELDDAVFTRARELLRTAETPVLVHCGSANRVAAVWIPWRVLDGGVPFEQALAEAKTIGLKTPEFETKAKDYIERQRR